MTRHFDKIIVLPRYVVESIAAMSKHDQLEFRAYHGPFAIISITGPEDGEAVLPEAAEATLRLCFDDICDTEAGEVALLPPPGTDPAKFNASVRRLVAMTDDDAQKIKAFIDGLPKEVTTLIVHCQAGISRSAGTAVGIAEGAGDRIMSETLRRAHPHFNKDICKRVRNTFGEEVD